jgi:hypothetical protein
VDSQRSGAGVSRPVCAALDDDRLAAPVRRERVRAEVRPVEPEGFRESRRPVPSMPAIRWARTPALRGTAAAAGLTLLFITAYALPVTD